MTGSSVSPPSLRQLWSAMSADAALLAAQTAALAKLELSAAVSSLVAAVVGVIVSIAIVLSGAAVLVAGLVLIGVALGLPPWAAALIVALLLIVSGSLAAMYFVAEMRRVDFDFKETRASVRETTTWLKQQVHE